MANADVSSKLGLCEESCLTCSVTCMGGITFDPGYKDITELYIRFNFPNEATMSIYTTLDKMLVHRGLLIPNSKFTSTHLYTWVERGTVRVKYLAREHIVESRPGLEPGQLDPIRGRVEVVLVASC